MKKGFWFCQDSNPRPSTCEDGMLPQDQWAELEGWCKNAQSKCLAMFWAPKFKFALIISLERKVAHQISNFF